MNFNPAIIPVVIEQHAEEAAFLWLLRDAAVYAAHYNLADLAHLDDRVEAHVDGLRIAGEAGWEICKEALQHGEPGEVFAAAVLAFESGDDDCIQIVLESGSSLPELRRALVSALGWLPYHAIESSVQRFLTSQSSALRIIGIAAAAVHRRDPGRPLTTSLSDSDPLVKARALRAVGQLEREDLRSYLVDNFGNKDISCRFYAAWSAILLGESRAVPVLQTIAETEFSCRQEAMSMALRLMDITAAHHWRQALAQNVETRRLAVQAAGVIGDPNSIPWLIEQMTTPELARVAGESFSMITGVDIAYEDLDGEWPKGFEAGPTEDPEDENVEMDPDEDLPWPNSELIEKWWGTHRGEFQSGARYLRGKLMKIESLQEVLRKGYQRQRAAAAIELAIRQPGAPLFEVRAPGFRQQQLLGLPITRG